MSIYTRVSTIMIGLLVIPAAVSCSGGGSGKSNSITVTVVPETPIVINANAKIDGKDFEGPWYSFNVNITNSSDEPLTIVALKLESTQTDSTGLVTKVEHNFIPGDFDHTEGDGATQIQCVFTDFGTIPAGQTQGLILGPVNTPACTKIIPTFVAGANKAGRDGKSFRYRVKIVPIGWFGTAYDPNDPTSGATGRFQKTDIFFTE
jgi:hypothetical protein